MPPSHSQRVRRPWPLTLPSQADPRTFFIAATRLCDLLPSGALSIVEFITDLLVFGHAGGHGAERGRSALPEGTFILERAGIFNPSRGWPARSSTGFHVGSPIIWGEGARKGFAG